MGFSLTKEPGQPQKGVIYLITDTSQSNRIRYCQALAKIGHSTIFAQKELGKQL